MGLAESTVHSFIIKLWLEDEGGEARLAWHGYITHVPSGTRRYLKRLSDITDFIKQYADDNDAQDEHKSTLTGWLRRLILNPTRQG